MNTIWIVMPILIVLMFLLGIGLDKEEIVQISRHIDTFETSILPYEDCCTVFTPKHPKTKPQLEKVEAEESKLNVDELVDKAFLSLATFYIRAKF